jgi:hypothetical protein
VSVFWWIGVSVCGGLGVLSVTLAYVWLSNVVYERVSAHYVKERREGHDGAVRMFKNAAVWFGEDEPTRALIVNLADGMYVEDARDNWRKDRASGAPRHE